MSARRRGFVAVALAAAGWCSGDVPASGAGDPLGCSVTVFDPADRVDDAELTSSITSTERSLGADVRVRVERAVDGELEDRLDQLVRQCDGWAADDGELDEDMVVVMFTPAEREAAVYYGADQGPVLEARWEPAVDALIVEVRAGDFTEGVEAALARLTATSPASLSFADRDDESGGGPGFPIGWVLLLVLIIGASLVYRLVNGDSAGGDWSDDDDDTNGWASTTTRRRSFGGGSSRSSRSGGGSGGRRSSGGSRRAGGGSKKW